MVSNLFDPSVSSAAISSSKALTMTYKAFIRCKRIFCRLMSVKHWNEDKLIFQISGLHWGTLILLQFSGFWYFFNRDFVFSSEIFPRKSFSRILASFAFARGFPESSLRVNSWQIPSRTLSLDFPCFYLYFVYLYFHREVSLHFCLELPNQVGSQYHHWDPLIPVHSRHKPWWQRYLLYHYFLSQKQIYLHILNMLVHLLFGA